jgi:hypothetical protein
VLANQYRYLCFTIRRRLSSTLNGLFHLYFCNLCISIFNLNYTLRILDFVANRLIHLLIVCLILLCAPVSASDSLDVEFSRKRLGLVTAAGGVIYGGAMIGVSQAWYRHYEQTSFQFFNDNAQWLQMDKAGHTMTAYYIGRVAVRAMQWTGTKRKKSIYYGAAYALMFQTTIEVMDAHSAAWGFSIGDMAANVLGSAILVSQELLWDEQRISLKFSTHPTKYAQYRPESLGNGFSESWLKDYNGQSYWLSVNPSSFMNEKPNWFPQWLNIAAGYSIDGVLGGTANPAFNQAGNPIPPFNRQRQFYLSLDVDLTRIKTNSKALKTCFELLSFVKIPAPALEFNQRGAVKFYGLYY